MPSYATASARLMILLAVLPPVLALTWGVHQFFFNLHYRLEPPSEAELRAAANERWTPTMRLKMPSFRSGVLIAVVTAMVAAVVLIAAFRYRFHETVNGPSGPARSSGVNTGDENGNNLKAASARIAFTNRDGMHFSADLPPGWRWNDGASFIMREGSWNVGTMSFDSAVAEDNRTPQEAAEHFLASLDSEPEMNTRSNSIARVADRRIIEVCGAPAVWDVTTIAPNRGDAPSTVYTTCFIRFGNRDIKVWSTLKDLRSSRSHQEVAGYIAECFSVVRSLQFEQSSEVNSSSVE